MKSNFIFDFDGTIADTSSVHKRAFQEALSGYKLRFSYNDYLGLSTKHTLKRIFEDNGRFINLSELNELVERKRRLANLEISRGILPISGALEFLNYLSRRSNTTLFLASSGSRNNISTGLRYFGCEHLFTQILTSEDVKLSKPYPDIFQKIVDDNNLRKAETIVIEDGLAGLKAAKSAGLDAICINRNLPQSDIESSFSRISFFDLIDII